MYNVLNTLVKKQHQQALNDFIFYCEFDERCHRALAALASKMERVGKARMQFSIKKWYQNTFDPVGTKDQIEVLADHMHALKLVSGAWCMWRNQMYDKEFKMLRFARGFKILRLNYLRKLFIEKWRGGKIWVSEIKVTRAQK